MKPRVAIAALSVGLADTTGAVNAAAHHLAPRTCSGWTCTSDAQQTSLLAPEVTNHNSAARHRARSPGVAFHVATTTLRGGARNSHGTTWSGMSCQEKPGDGNGEPQEAGHTVALTPTLVGGSEEPVREIRGGALGDAAGSAVLARGGGEEREGSSGGEAVSGDAPGSAGVKTQQAGASAMAASKPSAAAKQMDPKEQALRSALLSADGLSR